MTLFNPSSASFKHWMSAYANGQDIEEFGITNGDYKEFYKEATSVEIDDVVDALTSRPFAAFFYGYATDSGEVAVQVVHHVNKTVPAAIAFDFRHHELFGISGLQEDRKVVEIEPDIFSTAAGLRQATPSMVEFIAAATDGALFDALTPASISQEDEDRGKTVEGHPLPACFPSFASPILPFLVSAFGTTPEKPLIILKRVLLELTTFGQQNLSATAQVTLWDYSFPVVQHLWLLSQSSTASPCNAITDSFKPTVSLNEKYIKIVAGIESVWIESSGILPSVGTSRPVLMDPVLGRQLEAYAELNAKTASQTSDTLALLTQLSANNVVSSGGGKTWEKRFNDKCRSFILFASAKSPTEVPTTPTKDYKAFLESPKSQANSVAIQNINHQRNGQHTIDVALSTLLYGVELVQNMADDHPRGLSLFCAVSAPVLGAAASLHGGELDLLLDTHKITHEQIKKLMTPTIQVPTTDKDMVETFENGLANFDFVFGKESMVYASVDNAKALLTKHKRPVAIRCARDKNFIPAILTFVDLRVQEFLRSCTTASAVEDVDFSALNFGATLEEWLRNQAAISVNPPLAIINIMKKGKSGEKDTGAGDGGGQVTKRPNRQKQKRAAKKARGAEGGDDAENPAKVPEWILKKGEGLGPFHKQIKEAPKLHGNTVCIKWHIRGTCDHGVDCVRKASHCVLDAEKAKQMTAWIKLCRGGGN